MSFSSVQNPVRHRPKLLAIRLLHTAVWAFFVGCIVLLPYSASVGRFDWAAWQAGLVLAECLLLATNRFRCPLTSWAARYTDNRQPNFDIFLPVWLARQNQKIFGTLFGISLLTGIWFWIRRH